MFKYILILALSLTATFARELTTEQKLADLGQLVSEIRTGYGPLEYKKNNFGIDLDTLVAKYKTLIEQSKTNSEFYYLIIKFVAEFNDSHFGARIPTDHKATLNFTTDLVQGKVLIDKIDRKKLPGAKFPFERGDEIISLGGKPIAQVLENLHPYMGQGSKQTALRKAAMSVTARTGNLMPVPNGKVKLEIRKGDSEFIDSVVLDWEQSGTPLDEYVPGDNFKNFANSGINYDRLALEPDFRCSGATRIKIPEDATIIIKEPFVAYYHSTAKGNVGYLRIPHYSPSEPDPKVDAYKLRFKQYQYAVAELEKNTVGLIIDQDHNCGGSVEFLHGILSLFLNKPFQATQFELLANKYSYLDFMNWVKSENQYTIDHQRAKEVAQLIKDTWLNSYKFLTSKTSLSSRAVFPINEVNYTKPIIVLIDEMSGSGGDAFPAMMQGNSRAKLLGTRTMGAGGHVESLAPLTNSQIQVRITRSLFYHPNAVVIENNGASPDIAYSPTRDDFIYEYRGYQKFYLNELLKLIP